MGLGLLSVFEALVYFAAAALTERCTQEVLDLQAHRVVGRSLRHACLHRRHGVPTLRHRRFRLRERGGPHEYTHQQQCRASCHLRYPLERKNPPVLTHRRAVDINDARLGVNRAS
jgi:hypothetical protein